MSELEELPLDYWGRQKLFKERLAKIQGNATTIPDYRAVVDKLDALEREYELLNKKYDDLTKILRKQGKDRVEESEANRFLRNYARDWD